MSAGNNPLNLIAGASQSRLVIAGETFEAQIALVQINEDDTIIGLLEEEYFDYLKDSATYQQKVPISVIATTDGLGEVGQNVDGNLLSAGTILKPRRKAFTKVGIDAGSAIVYFLLSIPEDNWDILPTTTLAPGPPATTTCQTQDIDYEIVNNGVIFSSPTMAGTFDLTGPDNITRYGISLPYNAVTTPGLIEGDWDFVAANGCEYTVNLPAPTPPPTTTEEPPATTTCPPNGIQYNVVQQGVEFLGTPSGPYSLITGPNSQSYVNITLPHTFVTTPENVTGLWEFTYGSCQYEVNVE